MPIIGSFGAGSARGFGFSGGGFKPTDFDYLVVAGGGGGRGDIGGGGGAGGLRTSFPGGTKITITEEETPITIGAGGASVPNDGTGPTLAAAHGVDSTIDTYIVSAGGGYSNFASFDPGTSYLSTPNKAQRDGGSGAGQSHQGQNYVGIGNTPPTSPPQGFPGGPGGGSFGSSGGGGAGGAGVNGTTPGSPGNSSGPGGPGATNSISGSPVIYAGGGGGGAFFAGAGSGGSGGGGNGGIQPGGFGTPGTVNTGGGGGGATHFPGPTPAGNSTLGGSGIIYLRVPAANAPGSLSVSPGTNTVTTLSPSGDKLCTFTVSGTLTL
jgi:hypothetical protein